MNPTDLDVSLEKAHAELRFVEIVRHPLLVPRTDAWRNRERIHAFVHALSAEWVLLQPLTEDRLDFDGFMLLSRSAVKAVRETQECRQLAEGLQLRYAEDARHTDLPEALLACVHVLAERWNGAFVTYRALRKEAPSPSTRVNAKVLRRIVGMPVDEPDPRGQRIHFSQLSPEGNALASRATVRREQFHSAEFDGAYVRSLSAAASRGAPNLGARTRPWIRVERRHGEIDDGILHAPKAPNPRSEWFLWEPLRGERNDFDGYEVTRTGLRLRRCPRAAFYEGRLHLSPQPNAPLADLLPEDACDDAWFLTLLERVTARFGVFQFSLARTEATETFFARLEGTTGSSGSALSLRHLSPRAEWDAFLSRVSLQEISSVQFAGTYERNLLRRAAYLA